MIPFIDCVMSTEMYKRKVINSVNDYGTKTFWQYIFLVWTISKLMPFVPLLTKYIPTNIYFYIPVTIRWSSPHACIHYQNLQTPDFEPNLLKSLEGLWTYMGTHFMLLLSIYVLYSNVTYIYPLSWLVEIKLFQIKKIVSNPTFIRVCVNKSVNGSWINIAYLMRSMNNLTRFVS